MYVPPAFAETDRAMLHALIRENGFAVLASATEDGPVATHLPFLLETVDDGGETLWGHMARANPHWRALQRDPRALVVFSGPHAYVSPSWYAAQPAVPTWNYIAVHAYGRIEIVDGQQALDDLLRRMSAVFENGAPPAWRYDDLPADFRQSQIKGIVGFRMRVDRLEGKLKLSQNRPPGDADRVAAALDGSPDAAAQATAAAMRRFGAAGKAAR